MKTYRTGMYGGSFNPLHLGHVDCILRAAGRCGHLYLVLSHGLRRNEIDVKIRYRWLYQITKHIGNVTILILEDEAPEKSLYTPAMATEDADRVRAAVGEPIDAVFCGSDYGPDSFWNVCYPDSDFVVFPRNGMSSTEIRRDPYGHWDWLPAVVRPYYTKKVLLMGGESTGKSTLSVNLALRFNGGYVEEAGRELSAKSGTDRMMLSEDFTEILLQHKLNEMRAVEAGPKLLFIDTDALVTQFYMNFLSDPGIAGNRALSDAVDALNRYDLILFLEPDVAFVQDGDRSEIIHADRTRYSEQIKALLRSHGRPFTEIRGSYTERYEQAVRASEALLLPPDAGCGNCAK